MIVRVDVIICNDRDSVGLIYFSLIFYHIIYNKAMNFGKKVRNLDIFKKVPKDLEESTNIGGLVSILTVILISYLIFKEFNSYMNPEYTA